MGWTFQDYQRARQEAFAKYVKILKAIELIWERYGNKNSLRKNQ